MDITIGEYTVLASGTVITIPNEWTVFHIENLKYEFLKVSPFISFLATVINIIGSVTIAIGVNNISNKLGVTLIILGAILVLAGSLSTVFYPYARGWFNKNNAPV